MSRYRTIVADPPWEQPGGPGFDGRARDSWVKRNIGTRTNSPTKKLPYRSLAVAEIEDLPVAERAEDAAHLYLWVTNRYVEASYGIVRAWDSGPSLC